MFEDISKMEEEIKVFRQNILASSQLVESLNSIVRESQNQQSLMRQVSTDYQNEIKSISNTTIETIENMESKTIEEMKSMVNESLSMTVQHLSQTNQFYIDEMNKTDASIKEMQINMSDKYSQFLRRMENINIDELTKTCSELKKNLELRTTLAIIGVIVVIVLEIILLFVK